jgi:hypothetical protein
MALIQGNAHKSSVSGFYPKTIEGSLRFNDDDSAYLSWTPASAGNRKTWTWSGWVKRGNLGGIQYIFYAHSGNSDSGNFQFRFESANTILIRLYSNTNVFTTPNVFRDTSSWYHLVLAVDTTQASADDRIKLYVNGSQITKASGSAPSQNSDLAVNDLSALHTIGTSALSVGSSPFDGYLAEVNFIDGTALDADSFGELKNGVWVAKTPSVTYGTNGFYLPFSGTTGLYTETTGGAFSLTSSNDIQRTQGNDSAALFSGLITGDFDISFKFSPNSSSLTPGDAFSVGFFPKSGYDSLNYNNGVAGQSTYWIIRNGSGGASAVNNTDGTTALSSTTTSDVFQLTRTSGTFKIYKNSLLVHTFTTTGTDDGYMFFGSGDKNETITLLDITFNDVNGESSSTPFESALAIGGDASGRGNHWTSNNLEAIDVVLDSPTDNFATLNSVYKGTSTALSNGNLQFTGTASTWNTQFATIVPPKSGKWYAEYTTLVRSTSQRHGIGISPYDRSPNTFAGADSRSWVLFDRGELFHNNSNTGTYTTVNVGDVRGILLDNDANTVSWYFNGTLEATRNIDSNEDWTIVTVTYSSGVGEVNFGQQPFKYDPPE